MTETELITFGHSTARQDQLVDLLHWADVMSVVDVRIGPGSRHSPHLFRSSLARWMPQAGISYRWEPDLGGFRKAPADSPDVVWRNASFRGYASYMREPVFVAAMDRLFSPGSSGPTAPSCFGPTFGPCG